MVIRVQNATLPLTCGKASGACLILNLLILSVLYSQRKYSGFHMDINSASIETFMHQNHGKISSIVLNALNLSVDIRTVVFDDRVQSVYLLSEIPNALQPNIINWCQRFQYCGTFPYFWIIEKTLLFQMVYTRNNSIKHKKCTVIFPKAETYSFFPWHERFAEKYEGGNYKRPKSYSTGVIKCDFSQKTHKNATTFIQYMNNVSNISLVITFKINTSSTDKRWIDLYFNYNTQIQSYYNRKMHMSINVSFNQNENNFINKPFLNNVINSKKICFVMGCLRHPIQLYFLHANIEFILNVMQNNLQHINVNIIMYVDIKHLNAFISNITNVESFMRYYNINPKYLNDSLYIIEWKNYRRMFDGGQQLIYTDALYRFHLDYKWIFYTDPDEFLVINDYKLFEYYLLNLNSNTDTALTNTKYHSLMFNRIEGHFGSYFIFPNKSYTDTLKLHHVTKMAIDPTLVIMPYLHSVEIPYTGESMEFCYSNVNDLKKYKTMHLYKQNNSFVNECTEMCPFYLLHWRFDGNSENRKKNANQLKYMKKYWLNSTITEKQLEIFYNIYQPFHHIAYIERTKYKTS